MNILQQLNRSITATIFINVVFVILWLVSSFLFTSDKNDAAITIFYSIPLFSLSYFWGVIVQLICFMLLAFFAYKAIFLQYLTITTYLPFSVLMLLGTIFQSTHLFANQTFATIFLVLAIWQFIKIDTRKDNSVVVLNTFLLLMISVFFVPEFVYFVLIFIFGFLYFIELKIKTLIVIFFSITMPLFCILGVYFLIGKVSLLNDFFTGLFDFNFGLNKEILKKNIFADIISVILTLISLFYYWQNINSYKFRVRKFTLFLVILWLSTIFLILFLKNNASYFILTYVVLISFFISLYFTNLRPKISKRLKIKR